MAAPNTTSRGSSTLLVTSCAIEMPSAAAAHALSPATQDARRLRSSSGRPTEYDAMASSATYAKDHMKRVEPV